MARTRSQTEPVWRRFETHATNNEHGHPVIYQRGDRHRGATPPNRFWIEDDADTVEESAARLAFQQEAFEAVENAKPKPVDPPRPRIFRATRGFTTMIGAAGFIVSAGAHYAESDLIVKVHPDAFELVEDNEE